MGITVYSASPSSSSYLSLSNATVFCACGLLLKHTMTMITTTSARMAIRTVTTTPPMMGPRLPDGSVGSVVAVGVSVVVVVGGGGGGVPASRTTTIDTGWQTKAVCTRSTYSSMKWLSIFHNNINSPYMQSKPANKNSTVTYLQRG